MIAALNLTVAFVGDEVKATWVVYKNSCTMMDYKKSFVHTTYSLNEEEMKLAKEDINVFERLINQIQKDDINSWQISEYLITKTSYDHPDMYHDSFFIPKTTISYPPVRHNNLTCNSTPETRNNSHSTCENAG